MGFGLGLDQDALMQLGAGQVGGAKGRLLQGWLGLKKWGPVGLNVLANVADSLIPQCEVEAVVRVVGNPASKRRDLFLLAVSIATGMTSKLRKQGFGALLPPATNLIANFDMTKKVVEFRIGYRMSALGVVLNGLGGQLEAQVDQGDKIAEALPVMSGVDDDVIGDEYRGVDWLQRRILGDTPALPGAREKLLADDPSVENPGPPGDRVSRGAGPQKSLEGLLWESILSPPRMIDHSKDLKEVDPAGKAMGSAGAYTPAKTIPKPLANVPVPAHVTFWKAKGGKTQTDTGAA